MSKLEDLMLGLYFINWTLREISSAGVVLTEEQERAILAAVQTQVIQRALANDPRWKSIKAWLEANLPTDVEPTA